ncbi:hypothetical protein ACMFMG_005354 [Clarireedia jacksonii]
MRLLEYNRAGQLSLSENFVGDSIPEYAILSHTWAADTEEVTFQDLTYDTERNKPGYKKIYFCGEQARRDNLQYFWVDTCCIDKSNSTELAEAINSMFRWYHNAAKCYVYLSDVSTKDYNEIDPSSQFWQSFRKSRWFTRGWTLQELIAPRSLEFFCSNGRLLGDKKSLERQLHEITGIAVSALQGTDLSAFSVSERMLWAKSRETKREEDKVYSLLGIFDIYMPLIYGEGADHALKRLEEELQKRSKKHRLDEASTTVFSNPPKRPKTLHSQSLVACINDPNSFDPESHFSSEHNTDSVDAATKKVIIDKLYFPKIDERLTSLTAAQGKTCRWFLTKSEYISWHNIAQQSDHGGFLWIKGNPGTGKSTLMKFLFEEAKLNTKSDPSKIILSFFFLARGTVEEKSTTGLYCSLLHQLFEKAVTVKLRDSLDWMTSDGARVIERNGWNEEALKQTLIHAISKLGNQSLTIFVDALDECNQNQARGMVCFFEDLVELAQNAQVWLQICFSSRHYPTVTIQKGVEIILEDEIGHTEDVEKYIRSKLRLGKSKQAESEQAELLRSEILEKSSGIFLWVVLVLDILNSEYPNTSISIKKMRKRLKEIPPKLADLFEMILGRDEENIEQLQTCLKLILFANRPLKPQELYFAIQLNLDKECSGYWDQEDVDLHQIKSFVRSSSKGLAEVIRSNAAEVRWNNVAEVQFIHESVRDFLLDRYESQWSGLSSKFIGHGHEVLKNCCLAQLNAPISREVDILKFPFLGYSVLNILYHANSAQRNAIEQGDFLTELPLQQWIFLNNLLEKDDNKRYTKSASILYILAEMNLADLIRIYPYSESCFDFKDERYGPPIFAALATDSNEAAQALIGNEAKTKPLTSPLHDLCKQYCPEKKCSRRHSIIRGFTFSPQQRTVLSYIAEYGNEILLLFLLSLGKYIPDVKDKNGETPLWWAVRYGNEGVVKLLLDTGKVEIDLKDKDNRTPLLLAAQWGYKGIVKLLLDTGKVEIDSKDINGETPLSWAAQLGFEGVVKLLLDTGKVEIDLKDKDNRTLLFLTAQSGYKGIVKLLLDTGKVEIDSKDINGQTLLSWAAQRGYERVVKLLLDTGKVEIDSKDKDNRIPLSWAAQRGYKGVVKLLLDTGKVEIDLKDKDNRTPLLLAAQWGYKGIVKLLLDTGKVEIDSKDINGETPLSWAAQLGFEGVAKSRSIRRIKQSNATLVGCSVGREEVVKLLLDTGKVEIDSKDINSQTLLSWATQWGREEVVKLLLDTGKVEIDSKDKDDRTLLSWAAEWGREGVVKLLLDTGKVEIDSKDKEDRTLLSWAAQWGREGVVKLLLDTGKVEIDSKDKYNKTPLSWAARRGYKGVVKLLLDTGKVEIDSKDKDNRTPLSWAAEWGREGVVKLLLDTDKVEIDLKDINGQTPLSWAAQWGHEGVVNLLLNKGSNTNIESRDKLTVDSLINSPS